MSIDTSLAFFNLLILLPDFQSSEADGEKKPKMWRAKHNLRG